MFHGSFRSFPAVYGASTVISPPASCWSSSIPSSSQVRGGKKSKQKRKKRYVNQKLPSKVFETESVEELAAFEDDKWLKWDVGQFVGRLFHLVRQTSPKQKTTLADVPFFQERVLPLIRGLVVSNSLSIRFTDSQRQLGPQHEVTKTIEPVNGLERPLSGREVASLVLYLALGRVQDEKLWPHLAQLTLNEAPTDRTKLETGEPILIEPSWKGAQNVQRLCYGFAKAGLHDSMPELTLLIENMAIKELDHLSGLGAAQCAWGLQQLGSNSFELLRQLTDKALGAEDPLPYEQLAQLDEVVDKMVEGGKDSSQSTRMRNLEAAREMIKFRKSKTNLKRKAMSTGEKNVSFDSGVSAISAMCQPAYFSLQSRNKGTHTSLRSSRHQLPYVPNPPSFGAPGFPYRYVNDLARIYETNRDKIIELELARPLMAIVGALRQEVHRSKSTLTNVQTSFGMINTICEDFMNLSRGVALAEHMSIAMSLCEANIIASSASLSHLLRMELVQEVLASCLHSVRACEEVVLMRYISLPQILSFASHLPHVGSMLRTKSSSSEIIEETSRRLLECALSSSYQSYEKVLFPLFLRGYHSFLTNTSNLTAPEAEEVLSLLEMSLQKGRRNDLNTNDCIQLCDIATKLSKVLSTASSEALSSVVRAVRESADIVPESKPHHVALLAATSSKALYEWSKTKKPTYKSLTKDASDIWKHSALVSLRNLSQGNLQEKLQATEGLLRSCSILAWNPRLYESMDSQDLIQKIQTETTPFLTDVSVTQESVVHFSSILYSLGRLKEVCLLKEQVLPEGKAYESMQLTRNLVETLEPTIFSTVVCQQIYGVSRLYISEVTDDHIHQQYQLLEMASDAALASLSFPRLMDVAEGLISQHEKLGKDYDLAVDAFGRIAKAIQQHSKTVEPLNVSHLLRICTFLERLNAGPPGNQSVKFSELTDFIRECRRTIDSVEQGIYGSTDCSISLKPPARNDKNLRYVKLLLESLPS